MTVKELLKAQKYWTPIRICGGNTPKTFFSKRLDAYVDKRQEFIDFFGKFEISYFYYETNYTVFKALCKRCPKLFHWINPQTLVIELTNTEEVENLKLLINKEN